MVECAHGGITVAKLGFIGTGTMGNPIAIRLVDADHELVVTNVSRAATATPPSLASPLRSVPAMPA